MESFHKYSQIFMARWWPINKSTVFIIKYGRTLVTQTWITGTPILTQIKSYSLGFDPIFQLFYLGKLEQDNSNSYM